MTERLVPTQNVALSPVNNQEFIDHFNNFLSAGVQVTIDNDHYIPTKQTTVGNNTCSVKDFNENKEMTTEFLSEDYTKSGMEFSIKNATLRSQIHKASPEGGHNLKQKYAQLYYNENKYDESNQDT